MANIPQNLGSPVSTRTIPWEDQVVKAWGSEYRAPDHGIYQWSNGRKFDSTDKGLTGIYGITGDEVLLIDGTQNPDMREGLIAGVGTTPGAANQGFGSYQELTADPEFVSIVVSD